VSRATIWQEGNRLLLRLGFLVADSTPYEDGGRLTTRRAQVLKDLRQTFPGHRDCCWRVRQHCWSFPLRHREKLGEWLVHWYSADEVQWLEQAREVVASGR
jgi:hypothetical protein